MKSQSKFLEKLRVEAKLQSKLNDKTILPKRLGFFTDLIGNYSWQFLILISLVTAFIMELA